MSKEPSLTVQSFDQWWEHYGKTLHGLIARKVELRLAYVAGYSAGLTRAIEIGKEARRCSS